jgi:hypothetical protein
MLLEWQMDFARCLRTPGAEPPVMPGHLARFDIYRDSVIGSLVAALAEAFPVTRLIVGPHFFDAVAADHVRQHPPAAARLSAYGDTFPVYLQPLPALQDIPYVADVARLEWARIDAYFAGAADTVVTGEMLLQQPIADLPSLRFRPISSLRLVEAPTAIWSIWRTHQETEPQLAGVDVWQPEFVLLFCTRRHVVMQPVSQGRYRFVEALAAGHQLIEALAAANAVDPAFDLQAALVEELRDGTLGALVPGNTVEA